MEMKDEFLFKTHMLDKNGEKTGVDQIADYMFRADMIYRMKLASDMGLPVLTLIARELEEKFDENSSFPVTATKNDPNALYRQNVGRIAKFMSRRRGVSGFRRCQSRDIFRQVRYMRKRKKEVMILK